MNSVSTLSIAIASSNPPVTIGFATPTTDGARPFSAILAPFDKAATAAIRQAPAAPGSALPPAGTDLDISDELVAPAPTAIPPGEPHRAHGFAPPPPSIAPAGFSRSQTDVAPSAEDAANDVDPRPDHDSSAEEDFYDSTAPWFAASTLPVAAHQSVVPVSPDPRGAAVGPIVSSSTRTDESVAISLPPAPDQRADRRSAASATDVAHVSPDRTAPVASTTGGHLATVQPASAQVSIAPSNPRPASPATGHAIAGVAAAPEPRSPLLRFPVQSPPDAAIAPTPAKPPPGPATPTLSGVAIIGATPREIARKAPDPTGTRTLSPMSRQPGVVRTTGALASIDRGSSSLKISNTEIDAAVDLVSEAALPEITLARATPTGDVRLATLPNRRPIAIPTNLVLPLPPMERDGVTDARSVSIDRQAPFQLAAVFAGPDTDGVRVSPPPIGVVSVPAGEIIARSFPVIASPGVLPVATSAVSNAAALPAASSLASPREMPLVPFARDLPLRPGLRAADSSPMNIAQAQAAPVPAIAPASTMPLAATQSLRFAAPPAIAAAPKPVVRNLVLSTPDHAAALIVASPLVASIVAPAASTTPAIVTGFAMPKEIATLLPSADAPKTTASSDAAQPRSTEPRPATILADKPASPTIQTASDQVASALRTIPAPAQTLPRRSRSEPVAAADIALGLVAQPHATPLVVAQNTPLDMGRQGWPQATIERIEALRDAADAVDTSIRIVPDKLGAIEVSVRRDGDVTHVRFNAEQAQTRTILADAQPRLAELADARGLRLGQSSVDGSTGQHQPHQHRAPQTAFVPAAPSRPRRDEASSDDRIA